MLYHINHLQNPNRSKDSHVGGVDYYNRKNLRLPLTRFRKFTNELSKSLWYCYKFCDNVKIDVKILLNIIKIKHNIHGRLTKVSASASVFSTFVFHVVARIFVHKIPQPDIYQRNWQLYLPTVTNQRYFRLREKSALFISHQRNCQLLRDTSLSTRTGWTIRNWLTSKSRGCLMDQRENNHGELHSSLIRHWGRSNASYLW